MLADGPRRLQVDAAGDVGGGSPGFEEQQHRVGRAATQVREAAAQPPQAAVAGAFTGKGTNEHDSRDTDYSYRKGVYVIADPALEVSEAVEPASRWNLCLGDLAVAGAAPTFSERAGVFSVPGEATVSRLCLLRVDLLLLVFQGLDGNFVIRTFPRFCFGTDLRNALSWSAREYRNSSQGEHDQD